MVYNEEALKQLMTDHWINHSTRCTDAHQRPERLGQRRLRDLCGWQTQRYMYVDDVERKRCPASQSVDLCSSSAR